ncbi:MAG: hypothetical protein J0H15_14115 [Xanthomonadales bacterium]|nr:hypothetical protein [Xanthomonadales bacterium]
MRPAHLAAAAALATALAGAAAANPLSAVGETFAAWKTRLFGSDRPNLVDAPASGPVELVPGQPQRLRIDEAAPQREFPQGKSHYRLVKLPQPLAHAALRVQVVVTGNPDGRGNAAFKPLFYVLGEDGAPRKAAEPKPLHIDIRPFRRTRLLGCVTLEDVREFAVATTPEALGKSYESVARKAVRAPTQGGFHYATEPIKAHLPWIDTGQLILDISAEKKAGEGC